MRSAALRLWFVTTFCALASSMALSADRLAEVEALIAEYEAANEAYYKASWPENPTQADHIRRWDALPLWQYLPRFQKLAEAQPDDEAAVHCCKWIFERCSNVGNDSNVIFAADESAWNIIAKHHTHRSDLPELCLRAVQYYGPARERFLRDLLPRQDLPRESIGFATTALAELLAQKLETIESLATDRPKTEFELHLNRTTAPEWKKAMAPQSTENVKAESIELFRRVMAQYADVPVTISAPYFRDLKNLGEKASKSLRALEFLSIGSEAPAIVGQALEGKPLNLADYRGKVVVLSFWFTGCGPCMDMIPQEQRLVETYQGRPFALLGICADESADTARLTAAEHKMSWPCWFDGDNGPIARDYNVLGFPTIYVLDGRGRIVAKHVRGDALDAKVSELMREMP